MVYLLLGAIALLVLVFLTRGLVEADPKRLARGLRLFGGIALAGLAALLALGGRLVPAGFLAGLGLTLIGREIGARHAPRHTAERSWRARTRLLEIELDHAGGIITGRAIAGPHAGRSLDEIDVGWLARAWREAPDPDSALLLEAYLDRRDPAWREHLDQHAHTRHGGAADSGPMTEQQAYQILGLEPGAGPAEIRQAHRRLMKHMHPDRGGSTRLAARINAAKDLLLRRHRR